MDWPKPVRLLDLSVRLRRSREIPPNSWESENSFVSRFAVRGIFANPAVIEPLSRHGRILNQQRWRHERNSECLRRHSSRRTRSRKIGDRYRNRHNKESSKLALRGKDSLGQWNLAMSHLRSGRRQSIPSNNIDSCAAATDTVRSSPRPNETTSRINASRDASESVKRLIRECPAPTGPRCHRICVLTDWTL